jgi:WhiB family redox-sensing transcriptional regulator
MAKRVKPIPACRAYDPEIWFPLGYSTAANQSQIELAQLVCAGCPLRIGCLEYALENREADGIWGGLTPEERRGMSGVEGGKDELLAAMASA